MPLRMWGQYIIQDAAPAESPVMVGTLWYDTATSLLKVCTAVAPFTFTQVGGGAAVTSVAMTVPTGLSVSGSPITSAGTLAVTLTPGFMIPGGGLAGQVLQSQGALAPTFSTATYPATAGGAGVFLRSDGTNWIGSTLTLPNAATQGDLLIATGANAIGVLAAVASGSVLVSAGTGTAPAYSTTPSATTFTASRAALVTTSTDGLVATNPTAATAGTPVQISPRLIWTGHGWDTDNTVSRPVSFFTEVLPVSATTVSGTWKLGYIDPITSAITYPLTVGRTGAITATGSGSITSAGDLIAVIGGDIRWASATRMASNSSGQIGIQTSAGTAGVGLDVTTNAVLKIRTHAQDAYATVDALGYRVSGVAGVSAGPFTSITSITVVNGIVTALTGS